MTVFGIKPDNYFGDVVLAAADRDGLRIFQYAVRSAHESGQATFDIDGVQQRYSSRKRNCGYGTGIANRCMALR